MSLLEKIELSKNFKDALIKLLKDVGLHANTAILHLTDNKLKDAYCELFLLEAKARSIRYLFERIVHAESKSCTSN